MSYKITKKKIKKIKKSNKIIKKVKKTKFKGGGYGDPKNNDCPHKNQGSIFCLNYFKNLNKQHSIVKKINKINKNIPSNHNLQNLHLSNPLPVNTGYIEVTPY